METRVFRKIEEISPDDWNRVYPPSLEGYEFFKTLDECNLEQFFLRYILVYDQGRVVGAAPCFLMDYPVDTTIQGPLKSFLLKLKKIFPRLLNIRALMCGQPIGRGRIGAVGDSEPVVRAISDCMGKIGQEERVDLLVFKEFDPTFKPMLTSLKKEGYCEFSSIPNTEKELHFKSFDEFMMSLSYKTRYDLKKKFKKVDGHCRIDLEVVDHLGDVLEDAHRLYLQMIERHEIAFEMMPKEFFKKIAENMPGKIKFFLWRMEGKLVAFAFCHVSGDYFLDSYLGLDYAVAHQYHLYFVRFRDMFNWCLEHGIKTYEMGCTNYDPKKRLDFKFVPMTIYAKFRNRLLNRLLPLGCEFVKPERYDPTLKEIKKREAEEKKKALGVNPLTFKIFLLILANEAVDSVSQIFMKKGLPQGDINFLNFQEAARFLSQSAGSHFVWLGVAVYALNFFVWIAILSQLDLSLAVPLTSVNYALLPILAAVFLHEQTGGFRWVGIALIIFGVYLVSGKTKNKKPGPLS